MQDHKCDRCEEDSNMDTSYFKIETRARFYELCEDCNNTLKIKKWDKENIDILNSYFD